MNSRLKRLIALLLTLLFAAAIVACQTGEINDPIPHSTDHGADTAATTPPPEEPAAETIGTAPPSDSPAPPPPAEPITISMAVVGDIMVHSPQFKDAHDGETGEYDFSYQLEAVSPILSEADFAVGNLETTFAGGTDFSGFPMFNTPSELAQNLSDAGIDLLSTANNHCMDRRIDGLRSTLEVLDAAGISHVGTYASAQERDECSGIVVEDIGGITIAFLSYTYGTNGLPVPKGDEYAVNLIYTDYMTNLSIVNEELITADMAAARALEADLICVMMHWGVEYKTAPNAAQQQLADLLIENGADIILGGHPHVLQPFETRTVTAGDGTTRSAFVAYSLGNFISSQKDRYTDTSVVLNIQITKDVEEGTTAVSGVEYTPVYMLHRPYGAWKRHLLLDAYAAMASYEDGSTDIINSAQYDSIGRAITDVHSILGTACDAALVE